MKALSVERLLVRGRRVHSRFVSGALILLYHRVAEPETRPGGAGASPDPYALCVSPQHFEEHLDLLRRNAHPMPLAALVAAARQNALPPRAVAITFDDGYLDNLLYARPLLDRYMIPATVFIATGFCGGQFWWDELVRQVLQAPQVPPVLELTVAGQCYRWQIEGTEGRRRLLRGLHAAMRALLPGQREQVLDELAQWSGLARNGTDCARALTPDEIVRLADGGLVEIGAHTVNHPPLAQLPAQAQRQEVAASKKDLEEVTGRLIASFAYPYGLCGDYSSLTTELVREAGFARACTARAGILWRGSDVYQAPRLWVRDCSGEELARRLNSWWGRDSLRPGDAAAAEGTS